MEDGSSEGRTLSLELPAALDAWLAERSSELDVDRSELVLQALDGYRTAADSAEEDAVAALRTALEEGSVDLEETVRDAITDSLADRLYGRIETLESETEESLDDIRRRVVQVKQETDAKADADHSHPEFDRVDRIDEEFESLRERVAALEADAPDDLAADVAETRTRLTRLARVVTRLHEERRAEREEETTLDEIRRTAARKGHERAVCEACEETVRISLLPTARCPHCEYPFGRLVDGAGGLFGGLPRLVGGREDTGGEATARSELPVPGAGDGSGRPDEPRDGTGEAPMDGGSPVTTDGGKDD